MRERFRGALLGLAVGDALGTTREGVPPATSMAMCAAESLVECREFDAVDQLERFERTGELHGEDAVPDTAGSGPLMRLAPVPLAYSSEEEPARWFAALSARITHGDPCAADACEYFASLLVEAVKGSPKALLVAPREEESRLHPDVIAIARGAFLDAGRVAGGGLVTQALRAAMWAFATTDDFRSGALAPAGLGDDTDAAAAIYGQLAGAHYGAAGIPLEWRRRLVRYDDIVALADRLHDLAIELDG